MWNSLEIRITKFINPHKFWYELVSPETVQDRNSIEKRITEYVQTNRDPRDFQLQQGQMVALNLPSAGKWVRAEIDGIINKSFSNPEYLCWLTDLGYTVGTNSKYIRHLPTEISGLPQQLIHIGGIANVLPMVQEMSRNNPFKTENHPTTTWSKYAVELIERYVSNAEEIYFLEEFTYRGQKFGNLKFKTFTNMFAFADDVLVAAAAAKISEDFETDMDQLETLQYQRWEGNKKNFQFQCNELTELYQPVFKMAPRNVPIVDSKIEEWRSTNRQAEEMTKNTKEMPSPDNAAALVGDNIDLANLEEEMCSISNRGGQIVPDADHELMLKAVESCKEFNYNLRMKLLEVKLSRNLESQLNISDPIPFENAELSNDASERWAEYQSGLQTAMTMPAPMLMDYSFEMTNGHDQYSQTTGEGGVKPHGKKHDISFASAKDNVTGSAAPSECHRSVGPSSLISSSRFKNRPPPNPKSFFDEEDDRTSISSIPSWCKGINFVKPKILERAKSPEVKAPLVNTENQPPPMDVKVAWHKFRKLPGDGSSSQKDEGLMFMPCDYPIGVLQDSIHKENKKKKNKKM